MIAITEDAEKLSQGLNNLVQKFESLGKDASKIEFTKTAMLELKEEAGALSTVLKEVADSEVMTIEDTERMKVAISELDKFVKDENYDFKTLVATLQSTKGGFDGFIATVRKAIESGENFDKILKQMFGDFIQ